MTRRMNPRPRASDQKLGKKVTLVGNCFWRKAWEAEESFYFDTTKQRWFCTSLYQSLLILHRASRKLKQNPDYIDILWFLIYSKYGPCQFRLHITLAAIFRLLKSKSGTPLKFTVGGKDKSCKYTMKSANI